MMRRSLFAAALLAAPLFALHAQAQTPQRIRGTVASFTGDTLVVHERGGDDVTIHLAPDTAIRQDSRTTVDAIKPGSTLAIVSRGPADKQEAVAIRVVPTGSLARLGVFPWDLMPQSTMTNAVVEGQSVAASGHALTLKAGDSTVQMTIAPDAVVAEAGPGDKAMLVAGAHVVVFAVPEAGSAMAARAVVVGKDGLTPPV